MKSEIISLVVDDLISKAMRYNETLNCTHSLKEFDFAAQQLCKSRSKIIRWLKKL